MSLPSLINRYISRYGFQNYLEIGVSEGETFEKINAPLKHAVDTQFKYNFTEKMTDKSHYFQKSSDEYFLSDERLSEIDIVYLDGLHTFEQTLKDLLNVCAHSRHRALIIIDDVDPIDWFSSLNDQSETYKYRREHLGERIHYAWNGDVFKLIPFVHDFLPSFDYVSFRADGALRTMVWKSTKHQIRQQLFGDLEKISRLDYRSLEKLMPYYFEKNLPDIEEILDMNFLG